MNQELKEQTIKKFWETVLEVNVEDIKSETIYLVSDENLDSLIDKTVQMTEERIVGKLKDYADELPDELQVTGCGQRQRVSSFIQKDIISLITNKSELSTNKDEK